MINNSFNPFALFFGKTKEQQLRKELSKIQAAQLATNLQLLQLKAKQQGVMSQLHYLTAERAEGADKD